MAYTTGTEVLNTHSEAQFKSAHNTLAEVVGDKALLETLVGTSIVDAINSVQSQVNDLVVGSFALPNDTYFTGGSFGGGNTNILKVNTSNKIVFGSAIADIDIQGGVITSLTSPVPVTAGGTGGITQAAARTGLGLVIGSHVQAWDVKLDQIAALSPTDNNFIVGNGSAWTLETPSQARSSLGLVIGTNVQAWDTHLDQIAALDPTTNPTTDSFIVGVSAGTWLIKDRLGAQISLGLVIDTNVQAWNARLDQIAAIAPTVTGSIISWNQSTTSWIVNTPTQARGSLGLGSLAELSTINNSNWSGTVLSVANGGTGGNSQATGRSGLGLGSIATQSASLVAITGGAISATTILMANNVSIQWLDAGAAARDIIKLDSSSNLILNGHSSSISLQIAGSTKFVVDATSIVPNTADTYQVGSSTKRLDAGYFRTIGLINDISNTSADMLIGPIGSNNLFFRTAGTTRWAINSSGHVVPNANITYDVGSASAVLRAGYMLSLKYVSDIDSNSNGVMTVGPSGAYGMALRWDGATRLTYSSADVYPTTASGVNLGTSSNPFNGINAITLQAPGTNHLNLQTAGVGELKMFTNGSHRWSVGNTGIIYPSANNTYDIGIDNTNQVKNVYAAAYLTFTGCHRFDEASPDIKIGDPVYVEIVNGVRSIKRCSKNKDSRVAGVYKGTEEVLNALGEVERTIHIIASLGDNESGSLKGFRVSKKEGIPKNGDLLMVGTEGDLVLQKGTQIHSYTVGKCLQNLTENDFDSSGFAEGVYGVIYSG